MNVIKATRERFGVTQAALAEVLGCTQGNIVHLEQGQTIKPETAQRLIDFARSKGLEIDHRHVYGGLQLPAAAEQGPGAPAVPTPQGA